MDEKLRQVSALTPDSVVFKMIVDEMREIKANQLRNSDETKQELRRLHDKVDQLRTELRRDLGEHDKDIVRLDTQARLAGKISGALWGSVSGIAVAILAAMVQYFYSS